MNTSFRTKDSNYKQGESIFLLTNFRIRYIFRKLIMFKITYADERNNIYVALFFKLSEIKKALTIIVLLIQY